MHMRDTGSCPRHLCASAAWSGSVPQRADEERSEQSSSDRQMKEKLQWKEQGSISEPSAFQDCSSRCCLVYTTCSLQRCGTFHALDLWSHLGCSYNSVSSLWPAVRDCTEHFTKSVCFSLLNNAKKKKAGKEKQKVWRKGHFLSEIPLTDITLVSLGLRSVCVSASVHTHTHCLAPSPRGPGFPRASWSCGFLGDLPPQLPAKTALETPLKGGIVVWREHRKG